MTANSLGSRIKIARESSVPALTQAQLAERVKQLFPEARVSQQLIQQIESEDVKSSGYAVHMAVALGVDPVWLATGKEVNNNKHRECLTEHEHQLILWFRSCDEEGQQYILTSAAMAAQSHPRPANIVVLGKDRPPNDGSP